MRKFAQQLSIVWFVLFGVLFGTLAPTLSHAMAQQGPASFEIQVCSSAGIMTTVVMPGEPAAPAGDGVAHMFEHCPYCGQNGSLAALLAAPPALPAPPALAAGHPPRFYQSATPLFPWSASSPRAPPFVI